MMFSSWRLYSWMRLIWMSNRAFGSTLIPMRWRTSFASRSLFSRFTLAKASCRSGSPAWKSSAFSASVSSRKASPMRSRRREVSPGLHCISQRRGVMPLVLLLIRPGYSALRSENTVSFISSVCSAETPLIECAPTKARLPMRTRRSPLSSIRLM